MHDPNILAFEIKYPWYRHKPWPKKYRDMEGWDKKHAWKDRMTDTEKLGRDSFWTDGYRETFISIWHLDPEKNGSDDSCGWSYVKLTRKQRNRLHNAAWSEARTPHFLRCMNKTWDGTMVEAESLQRGIYVLVCRVLRIQMSWDQISRLASESTHIRDCIKAGSGFCFLPGYHSNNSKDNESDREQYFEGILCSAARLLLTELRPWWKHPKWHFWHWKFQCHPLASFKRWAFSRCCKCHKRFTWGYSPVTNNWDSKGPRWFRGETDVCHSDCNSPKSVCVCDAIAVSSN